MQQRNPNYEFQILRQSSICKTSGQFDDEKFKILKNGKSSLPYEKLTMEYLFACNSVPPKEDYYSDLKNQHIDNQTYQDICQFWTIFNCANLGNTHSFEKLLIVETSELPIYSGILFMVCQLRHITSSWSIFWISTFNTWMGESWSGLVHWITGSCPWHFPL